MCPSKQHHAAKSRSDSRSSAGHRIDSRATIDLVLAIDDNYCLPGVVMLTSALQNMMSDKKVRVFVLASDLGRQSRQRLLECVNGYDATLVIIDCAIEELRDYSLGQNDNLHYISAAPAAKLSLDRLLPTDVSRAIMLDCDIVVRGNLADLWSTRLNGHIVGAVLDGHYPCIGLAEPALASAHSISAQTPYFNSGVMLIDMQRWREARISDICWEIADNVLSETLMQDQTVFNLAFKGRFQQLSPQWNSIKALMSYACAQASPYAGNGLDKAIEDPAIVHYVGVRKPWLATCRHPWRHEFSHYLAQTQFKEYQITEASLIESWLEDLRARDLPVYRILLNRRRLSVFGMSKDIGLASTLWAFTRRVCKSPRILAAPFLFPLLWIIQRLSTTLSSRSSVESTSNASHSLPTT